LGRAIKTGLVLAALACGAVLGCGWQGAGEVSLRNAPYPYDACAAIDDGADVDPLPQRGVGFVWSGLRVGTIGQDSMCSLIDRGRQLWEALRHLAVEREWRGSSFFGNRLAEAVLADGSCTHAFKTCVGRVPLAGGGIPDHVAVGMADAAIYELRAKGGLSIIGSPPNEDGLRRPAVLAEPVTDLLFRQRDEGRLYLVDIERLLAYDFVRRHLDWSAETREGTVTIDIRAVDDGHGNRWVPSPKELRGITFYTPDALHTRVLVAGRETTDVAANGRDNTRRESVTILGRSDQ
jgi:hypothetical protein